MLSPHFHSHSAETFSSTKIQTRGEASSTHASVGSRKLLHFYYYSRNGCFSCGFLNLNHFFFCSFFSKWKIGFRKKAFIGFYRQASKKEEGDFWCLEREYWISQKHFANSIYSGISEDTVRENPKVATACIAKFKSKSPYFNTCAFCCKEFCETFHWF